MPPQHARDVMSNNIVIVGAGECGANAALALREFGYDGSVILVGNEPTAPYERPTLTKGISQLGRPTIDLRTLIERKVEVKLGTTATQIDPFRNVIVMDDGGAIEFERALLATGSSPRRLPSIPISKRVSYIRTLDDALNFWPRIKNGTKLAVLGAGLIGLEVAAVANTLGADVRVFEAATRIMRRSVPDEIAVALHDIHTKKGVSIHCGVGLAEVEERADCIRVRLEDYASFEAEFVLVAVGCVPSVELAKSAGIPIENGIAVNCFLQTSNPSIYAAGDCCSFPFPALAGRRVRLESWRSARELGIIAATNMLGGNRSVDIVPWFWSDQYEITLQVAGIHDDKHQIVRRDLSPDSFVVFGLDDEGRVAAASGIGPGTPRTIKIAERLISRAETISEHHLRNREIDLRRFL
ncbi:ferredoxin reductase [Sinorhizobium meliloti]|nr:ferredoxin reductase [Sinorhizobium meliloti]MQX68453.1 ferredoxin reductase [Sinorhizobium meliloti]